MFETFGKAITCAQCTRPKARAHTHKITCGHTQLVKYWGGGEIIDKQRKNQQIIYQTLSVCPGKMLPLVLTAWIEDFGQHSPITNLQFGIYIYIFIYI